MKNIAIIERLYRILKKNIKDIVVVTGYKSNLIKKLSVKKLDMFIQKIIEKVITFKVYLPRKMKSEEV